MSPSLEEQFEGKTGITPTVNKVDSKRKKKKKKKTKANRPIGPTRAQDFAGQQLVKPQWIVRTVLVGATVISFIAGFISQSLRVTFAIIGGATIFLALFVIPPWPIFNRHPVKRLLVETESYINQDQLVHEAYHKRVSVAGTNTFDAILFGVNETKPRLIKLPWSHAVNEGLPWQKLDRELWFNSREHFLRTMYV